MLDLAFFGTQSLLRFSWSSVVLMHFVLPVCLFAAIRGDTNQEDLTSSQLEQRLVEIDEQLGGLARYSMRGGVGAIGYRSQTHDDRDNTEWVRIDLERECLIDEVVLVPTIWRDTRVGFKDDGFPAEFVIVAGNREEPDGIAIARYGPENRVLPRIAPLVISCPGTRASWVRVEATSLSPRAWDGKYILQFSEILIFSGPENVALRQTVHASSPEAIDGNARRREFLVDGFVPYLMDAQQGAQSIAFLGEPAGDDQISLTIDLVTPEILNRIHLHSLDLSDTVPQSPADFGMPRRMVVEGATCPDFSDAVRLTEYHMESVFDVGPIIVRRFPDTACRYVRLVVSVPYVRGAERSRAGSPLVGFAEIELYSRGRNVALGKPVSSNLDPITRERSLTALTDGRNLYGKILPTRGWLNELALRNDLEAERPLVVAELNHRYRRQSVYLNWLIWTTVVLVSVTVCMALIHRIARQRAILRMREHIAADLHDELGANLHAIGLLGDLARASSDSPKKLRGLLERIRALTERSGAAARYCVNMLESQGLYDDLVEDMRRTSARIMADLDHEISFDGEDALRQLPQRRRIDLFLFYKECLINIIRHSGATRVRTRLKGYPKELCLTISDNGRGLPESPGHTVPSSLNRRARLLGANVTVGPGDDGGTSVTLRMRIRKSWTRRQRASHE